MGNLQEERWHSSTAVTGVGHGTWTCFSSRTCDVTGKRAWPTDLHSSDKWAHLVYLQLLALGPCLNSLKPFLKMGTEGALWVIKCQDLWSHLGIQSPNLPSFPAATLLLPSRHGLGLNSSHIPPPVTLLWRLVHKPLQLCQDNHPFSWGHLLVLIMDWGSGFHVTAAHVFGLLYSEPLYLLLEGSHPGLAMPWWEGISICPGLKDDSDDMI